MLKLVVVCHRREGWSRQRFRDYFREVHGPLAVAIPHVARYVQNFVEPDEIEGDPPRLGQAVLNLLIDAAQAFDHSDRERNVVAVTLRSESPWVVLEVADNGRTIDPPMGDAFEPFFPIRGAASTGIGLAVTRTIVSSLGGTATLAPRDGGGAVATIRLPQR